MADVALAVVGAHLEGQPLHHQLTERAARLVARTSTAPTYRLYALRTEPPKPGLVRIDPSDPAASAIEVEVYDLGVAAFGSLVAAVPSPLAVGRVVLADGTEVSGFVCEPIALADAVEITDHGGWRAYLRTVTPGSSPAP